VLGAKNEHLITVYRKYILKFCFFVKSLIRMYEEKKTETLERTKISLFSRKESSLSENSALEFPINFNALYNISEGVNAIIIQPIVIHQSSPKGKRKNLKVKLVLN